MNSLFKPECKYVIDSSSIIDMYQNYKISVFPGVWKKVSDLAENKILISCEDVFEELLYQEDILDWAKRHHYIFIPLDIDTQYKTREILNSYPNLIDIKKGKSSADPFVVATAIINSCVVVTEERPSGGPNKVKIPDVCKIYEVKCIRLIEMLEIEGLKL